MPIQGQYKTYKDTLKTIEQNDMQRKKSPYNDQLIKQICWGEFFL